MTASVFSGLKLYASSKSRNDNESNKIRPALPIRWMAPEALQYHIYSVETDVFAFGIVLWELSTLGEFAIMLYYLTLSLKIAYFRYNPLPNSNGA